MTNQLSTGTRCTKPRTSTYAHHLTTCTTRTMSASSTLPHDTPQSLNTHSQHGQQEEAPQKKRTGESAPQGNSNATRRALESSLSGVRTGAQGVTPEFRLAGRHPARIRTARRLCLPRRAGNAHPAPGGPGLVVMIETKLSLLAPEGLASVLEGTWQVFGGLYTRC